MARQLQVDSVCRFWPIAFALLRVLAKEVLASRQAVPGVGSHWGGRSEAQTAQVKRCGLSPRAFAATIFARKQPRSERQ